MTLPFDLTKPEERPNPITFYTDDSTYQWVQALVTETGIDRSLLVHRMVEHLREAAQAPEGERRAGDDRRRVSV